ncbi:MAG: hypothetical protein AB2A00_30900, partial [Myxococcota bacterium]
CAADADGGVFCPTCSDNSTCTEGDHCSNGICVGNDVSDTCPDDNNPCTSRFCDPFTGCGQVYNTAPCDDGLDCTINDRCAMGTCAGTSRSCDDSNPCTTGTCIEDPWPDGGCPGDGGCPAFECAQVYNTAICNDGNACTLNDSCSEGACTGTPRVCNDNNPCTADTCHPLGGCQYPAYATTPATDDAGTRYCAADADGGVFCPTCSDNSTCTEGDHCSNGICVGNDVSDTCPDDDNPCTSRFCDPFAGCGQVYNAAPCDDGDACSVNDRCSGGGCSGEAVLCPDDDNACTTTACDPSTGCGHVFNAEPCDDGDYCTVDDLCAAGACSGVPRDCSDGNPCTDDACDSVMAACVHLDNFMACDDGDACTGDDACTLGACVGTPVDCTVQDPCLVGECVPALGCVQTPREGICDDGDPCTAGDACRDGRCEGQPLTCDDGDACTWDVCETGSCTHRTLCGDGGVPSDAGASSDAAQADGAQPGAGMADSGHDAGGADAAWSDAGAPDVGGSRDGAPDVDGGRASDGAIGLDAGEDLDGGEGPDAAPGSDATVPSRHDAGGTSALDAGAATTVDSGGPEQDGGASVPTTCSCTTPREPGFLGLAVTALGMLLRCGGRRARRNLMRDG